MKGILLFFTGMGVGAVLALLYAPESGQALRSQIGQEVAQDRQELNTLMQQNLDLLQERVDSLHAELTTYIQAAQQEDDG